MIEIIYIDRNYYVNEYQGISIPEQDFEKLSHIAEIIVEEMSMFRLNPSIFASIAETKKIAIKQAVCAQMEFLQGNGGLHSLNEADDMKAVALGSFRYVKAETAPGEFKQRSYAPLAIRYLMPSGLLYRGGV